MRKRFLWLMLMVLIGVVIPPAAMAENVRESGLYTYKIKGNGTISIVDFHWEENQGDIYIPSMIDGYTVTTISSEAFADGNVVGASPCLLVLPNTITLIEDKAFFNSPITTVSVPSSLQSLGKGVFAYCSISQFIVDPSQANFAAIDGALYNKKTRTLLAYPQNSVVMTKVPEGIVAVADYAFSGIEIGGYDTLAEAGKLIQINTLLPSTIESIGAYAFENCTLYYNMSVQAGSLYQYTNNGVMLLPESVSEIGERAFANVSFRNGSYSGVKRITLGSGIKSIGDEAFVGCRWYDSAKYELYLTGQEQMDFIGDRAFAESEIYSLGNEVASIHIVLPDSIGEIGEYAFCKTHWIDASNTVSVQKIGSHAFEDTVVFAQMKTVIYQEDAPQTLTVWGTMDEVPEAAFAYRYQNESNSIEQINVQDGVKSIGTEAFMGMSAVKKVMLPQKLESIGKKAFADCDSLTELTIPETVSQIGDDAFKRSVITLIVERDSYAALWAVENGYNYRYSDEVANALEWLGIAQTSASVPVATVHPTSLPTTVPTDAPLTSAPVPTPFPTPLVTPHTPEYQEEAMTLATPEPSAVLTPLPMSTLGVQEEAAFEGIEIDLVAFEGSKQYHFDRFDESWYLEAEWNYESAQMKSSMILVYSSEKAQTHAAPELFIQCFDSINNQEMKITAFRAIIDHQVFAFEELSSDEKGSSMAGGSVMRSFLDALQGAETIAFQFETEMEKLNIESAYLTSLADWIAMNALLEKANVWSNVEAYQQNDVLYKASIRKEIEDEAEATSAASTEEHSVLEQGARGSAVEQLQSKLLELGFYLSKVDGNYGNDTTEAVELFQQVNDLSVSGIADVPTLDLLYGGTATPYRDPEMTLRIEFTAAPRIDKLTTDRADIRFQVENIARIKKIIAFELYIEAYDVWGQKVGESMNLSTAKSIQPLSSGWSACITVEGFSNIANVSCALHKVAYSDGTVYIVPESQMEYVKWNVQ